MKLVIIVSCLLATAAANTTDDLNKMSEAWKDPIAKCGKQYGFTDMNLQEIYEKEERDGTGEASCFHACLLKSLGMLNFFGIDARKLGKSVEGIFADQPEVAAKTVQAAIQCIPEVASIRDECEMSYQYSKCYMHTR